MLELRSVAVALIVVATALAVDAAALEPVRIDPATQTFVLHPSGKPFEPWGFNYDHDRDGRLLEDYWFDEWDTVVGDFHEMKALGANAVRIHLQFNRFMDAPDTPNERSLAQLDKLIALAQEVGLYLNITGLGCYHRADTPAWYDALDEKQRWDAQANFWRAVAGRAAKSPAIFCYDLMNEPVVAGGASKDRNWLPGKTLGGKSFVQLITLDPAGRQRPAIARQWIEHLTAAIREVDREHLITVGLVPWSLKRPGLQSGFEPEAIAPAVDFISVHIYPDREKLPDAMATLRGFDVGKPVVIEETFPLKCTAEQLGHFMDVAEPIADGWFGFYWGQTIEEMTPPKTIAEALKVKWLELFQSRSAERGSRK